MQSISNTLQGTSREVSANGSCFNVSYLSGLRINIKAMLHSFILIEHWDSMWCILDGILSDGLHVLGQQSVSDKPVQNVHGKDSIICVWKCFTQDHLLSSDHSHCCANQYRLQRPLHLTLLPPSLVSPPDALTPVLSAQATKLNVWYTDLGCTRPTVNCVTKICAV